MMTYRPRAASIPPIKALPVLASTDSTHCALGLGDRLRTIGAAVVGHNDLAGDSVF